jgi:hypothetical protein
MLRSRVEELDRRVRESELFPRIRDAEVEMALNEKTFIKRQIARKKQREIKAKGEISNIPKLPPITDTKEFFSTHVLNKDPSAAAYMPFNEVFFPRLFNPVTEKAPPHSIDELWMLGFQHEALRPKELVVHKSIEFK